MKRREYDPVTQGVDSVVKRRRRSPRPTRGRGMGTATMLCPKCESVSKVLRTGREGSKVIRHRECLSKKCRHRFHTTERSERDGAAAVSV